MIDALARTDSSEIAENSRSDINHGVRGELETQEEVDKLQD